VFHRLLLDLLAVLHPCDSGRGSCEGGLEGGGAALVHGEGGGEALEHGAEDLLTGDVNDEGAGGEALAHVVEGLTGVRTGVLGEDLMDDEAVCLPRRLVLEVFRRLDLLLIVQPDDVQLISTT